MRYSSYAGRLAAAGQRRHKSVTITLHARGEHVKTSGRPVDTMVEVPLRCSYLGCSQLHGKRKYPIELRNAA